MTAKKKLMLTLGLLILAMASYGCGTKTQVVLLPEADGTVGKVLVEAGGETAVLDRSYQGTRISEGGTPSTPKVWDRKEVTGTFKSALEIQPLAPVKYILYFEFGTAELTPASRAMIPEILESIRNRNLVEASVSGHTDRVGDARVNKDLALVRAREMRDILLKAGVAPDRISIESHGEGNPLIPTADGVSEPRNRRVEVVIR